MDSTPDERPILVYFKEDLEKDLPYPLLTIYQAMGLSEAEAQVALKNTSVIRIDKQLIQAILQVHQESFSFEENSLIEQISLVLEPYRMRVVSLGELPIVNLLPLGWTCNSTLEIFSGSHRSGVKIRFLLSRGLII